MEIIGQVFIMTLLIFILGVTVSILSFLNKMLNPKFRKQYYLFKNICKEIKLTGDLDLLNKFITSINFDDKIYNLFYDNNNRINDDELYNTNYDNSRKEYIKIIEIVNHFSLENCLKSSLKSNNISNKPLALYLLSEINELSDDLKNKDLNNRIKILKSKSRFIGYLIKNNDENERYLKSLLEKIKVKIK
ncbi:hypothetical protein EC396_11335 [Lutibacter sp. HS1-25]|uniref:hypothetical protein n=1 Tax=Lutibacter sp. HS1-25 TaxID=2485000 RepID=UPI00101112A8|nr:hypothetical protein [Lutibacter sp. HS1-25]RXP52356.1 hypothetical protein EC396_11335 [Lutibacter sp. HS1-25]